MLPLGWLSILLCDVVLRRDALPCNARDPFPLDAHGVSCRVRARGGARPHWSGFTPAPTAVADRGWVWVLRLRSRDRLGTPPPSGVRRSGAIAPPTVRLSGRSNREGFHRLGPCFSASTTCGRRTPIRRRAKRAVARLAGDVAPLR